MIKETLKVICHNKKFRDFMGALSVWLIVIAVIGTLAGAIVGVRHIILEKRAEKAAVILQQRLGPAVTDYELMCDTQIKSGINHCLNHGTFKRLK